MKCFREMIEVSQLYDISFKGQRFTWFGLRDQAWVKERLDRALVNLDWMEACPNTQGFNLPAIGSDHSPMVVFSDFRDKKVKKKFKFEAMWLKYDSINEVVSRCWGRECGDRGFPKLSWKLKKCSEMLKEWSRKNVRNGQRRIQELKLKIGDAFTWRT
ncbi:hypothetical protein ES288_D03G146900v1 [Gossypium darwinii]|uniref:Endonuclease/exonuclease/phosphatase domain-containing protein n=1 Tax=Gossypium darwinii TaxID=34276 RepID=A0A5D2D5H1_GOSDA|nr:hypothetical protein ES288_D03G146900v1 [Gossypium darwinii]